MRNRGPVSRCCCTMPNTMPSPFYLCIGSDLEISATQPINTATGQSEITPAPSLCGGEQAFISWSSSGSMVIFDLICGSVVIDSVSLSIPEIGETSASFFRGGGFELPISIRVDAAAACCPERPANYISSVSGISGSWTDVNQVQGVGTPFLRVYNNTGDVEFLSLIHI